MFISEQARRGVEEMQQRFNALSDGKRQALDAALQRALQQAASEADRREEACRIRPEDLHTPLGPTGTLPVF